MTLSTKYNETDFILAAQEARSWRDLSYRLGLTHSSTTKRQLERHALSLDVNTDHFLGRSWAKGKKVSGNEKWGRRWPLEEILIEDSPFRGNCCRVKKRLIAAGLLVNQCLFCGITEWQGKPITLELDHINGKRMDYRIENLRILCPNCHSQTETFAGKQNKG